jgi:hypothetical protein
MDRHREEKGTRREQLLARLLEFERALGSFVPGVGGCYDPRITGAELQQATEELRQYLATHVAPQELLEWRELPDSDAELTAFAYELQIEHQEILQALAALLNTLEELERSLDRHETATRIGQHGRAVASRIARHVAWEEARFGI